MSPEVNNESPPLINIENIRIISNNYLSTEGGGRILDFVDSNILLPEGLKDLRRVKIFPAPKDDYENIEKPQAIITFLFGEEQSGDSLLFRIDHEGQVIYKTSRKNTDEELFLGWLESLVKDLVEDSIPYEKYEISKTFQTKVSKANEYVQIIKKSITENISQK